MATVARRRRGRLGAFTGLSWDGGIQTHAHPRRVPARAAGARRRITPVPSGVAGVRLALAAPPGDADEEGADDQVGGYEGPGARHVPGAGSGEEGGEEAEAETRAA